MAAAGFVLVGGRSHRMGRDKALLPWRSGVLVQDVVAKAATICHSVALVGSPERYAELGFDCLADLRPGLGPLAGLETALGSSRAEYNLLLACDMPDVSVDHLAQLLRTARQTGARCVITRDEAGRTHPLCAVYRATCLPYISRALDEGRLKLLDIVSDLSAATVSAALPIQNINTCEDWEALRAAHGF